MPSSQEQRPKAGKIDVHHHIFLPQLWSQKAEHNAKAGFTTPKENIPWSITKSLQAMDQLGVAAAVLSYPAGMPENLVKNPFEFNGSDCGQGQEDDTDKRRKNREAVRELNLYAQKLCDEDEASGGRFGWFAALPDWRDVDGRSPPFGRVARPNMESAGVLLEIEYALDVLHADGVSISSSYGQGSAAGESAGAAQSHTSS